VEAMVGIADPPEVMMARTEEVVMAETEPLPDSVVGIVPLALPVLEERLERTERAELALVEAVARAAVRRVTSVRDVRSWFHQVTYPRRWRRRMRRQQPEPVDHRPRRHNPSSRSRKQRCRRGRRYCQARSQERELDLAWR